jgi:putative SOS response-associated peptidase YedK
MLGLRRLTALIRFVALSKRGGAWSPQTVSISGGKVIGGKIPYSIEMKDDSPFVFAGLWEGWQNPETQEWLRTCTIITGKPNELVAEIHTRMPVILPLESHDRWLTGEAGKEVLRPFPDQEMKIRPVSTRVNKPENNDAGLLEEGEMEQVGRLI